MSNEIRAVLTRHLPGYEIRSLAKLGGGRDNVVYEVNGELVVRLSRRADPATRGDSTRREAGLRTGARVYAEAGPDHLAWTFAQL